MRMLMGCLIPLKWRRLRQEFWLRHGRASGPPPGLDSVSAERAQRLSAAAGRLPLKGGFDQLADDFAVDGVAGEAGHDRFHDLSHVFDGRSTGLGHHHTDDPCDLVGGERGGEVALDDGNFLPFFGGEVLTVAFFKLFGGFLALLDERGHDAAHSGVVEILFQFHFFVLHGSFNHPDHVDAQLIARFHCRFEIFAETVMEGHRIPFRLGHRYVVAEDNAFVKGSQRDARRHDFILSGEGDYPIMRDRRWRQWASQ